MNKNNLSTAIFIALSDVAHEVFKRCVTECEAGQYSAKEIDKGMSKGRISFEWNKAKEICWENISGGVSWADESKEQINISFPQHGWQCSFALRVVFYLLCKYAPLAREERDLTAKQVKECCTFVKSEEVAGEIVCTAELPENTAQILKVTNKENCKTWYSLCLDANGYIVATDGYILNVAKCNIICKSEDFTEAMLPVDFAKSHAGQTVEIISESGKLFARCENETVECIDGHYPRWKACIPKVSEGRKIEINVKAFVKVAKQTAGAITYNGVYCDSYVSVFGTGNGMITVYSKSDEGNEKQAEMSANYIPRKWQVAFAVPRLAKIMPGCNRMYLGKDNSQAVVFAGDGFFSMVMPYLVDVTTDEYKNAPEPYFDAARYEEVDALQLLDAGSEESRGKEFEEPAKIEVEVAKVEMPEVQSSTPRNSEKTEKPKAKNKPRIRTLAGEPLRKEYTALEAAAIKHAVGYASEGETFTGSPTSNEERYRNSPAKFRVELKDGNGIMLVRLDNGWEMWATFEGQEAVDAAATEKVREKEIEKTGQPQLNGQPSAVPQECASNLQTECRQAANGQQPDVGVPKHRADIIRTWANTRGNAMFYRWRHFAVGVGNYSTSTKRTAQTQIFARYKRMSCRGSPKNKVQTKYKQSEGQMIKSNNK